jgi:adenosylcobalamin-dependent ribonucleoside-triphosphate reductase
MSDTFNVPAGMARSIWENKYSRRKDDGTFQTWAERVHEVVAGNASLGVHDADEHLHYLETQRLARAGILAFSGRHLQHGDKDQRSKYLETFTNCSTSMFSFVSFWLLLKGSGVGRSYDSDLCRVNWDDMPGLRVVLDASHPDYEQWIESRADARHKYDSESEAVRWFAVEDSAEGWVKVVEALETAAYQGKHSNKLFVFDFSAVRGKGQPIAGQQGRPSSGPVPFMRALLQVASIKGAGFKPWKQALFVDHYLAACVAVGGVRRAARIAVKSWRDRDVIEFIDIKRGGHLWSANNSVGVDAEFWEQARQPGPSHGRRVFQAATCASYYDRTGEPGFLNQDMLTRNDDGLEGLTGEALLGAEVSAKLGLHRRTIAMFADLLDVAKAKRYHMIVNPCGELCLTVWGGYCVIGDLGLGNVRDPADAKRAAALMGAFLVRCNTMPSLYEAEVKRTNRIGVGLTGIHEFAWQHFGLTWQDLTAEHLSEAALDFWYFLAEVRFQAIVGASHESVRLGLPQPHTVTTIKPSGTISKVLGCTEGAHLPAYAHYLRWVQYTKNGPEAADLEARGYPVKDVSHQYAGHVVVGFPTCLGIAAMMGDRVTLAGDATMTEQFRWLQRLECYWLGGLGSDSQVSYTLKFNPEDVSYSEYMDHVLTYQPTVRACAVMPQIDKTAYAYQPEEPISPSTYAALVSRIDALASEGYDEAALACEGGACPIEPNRN